MKDFVAWSAAEVWRAATNSPPSSVEDALTRTLIAAGPVGVFFLAVIFKFKLMTVSEHLAVVAEKDSRIASQEKTIDELKASLREANAVYTAQVIPTLTRVLDAERELVDLRRAEQQQTRWRRADPEGGGGGRE